MIVNENRYIYAKTQSKPIVCVNSNVMNRESYKLLDDKLPIFFKSWWLNSVCEDGEWVAESFGKNDRIQSVFVYFIKRKFGLRYIVMPPLTQYLGEYSFTNNSLNDCKSASRYYIDHLPKTAFAVINMSHSFRYWTPYLWCGFNQTTRYSLKINNLTDIDSVFANFDDSKKRNIRKAAKLLKIKAEMPGEEFYDFFAADLSSKNQRVNFSRTMFVKLYSECVEHQAGTILYATDTDNVTYGALFVVWDDSAMYALTYSFPDKYRSSGVGDFLMFNAIKLAATKTKTFDFEGSMLVGVEQSYQRFGTVPAEYYQISKISSPILRIFNLFKPLF